MVHMICPYRTFWTILNWFSRIALNINISFFPSFVPSILHRTSNFCLKISILLLFLLFYLIFRTLTALLFFFKLSFPPWYYVLSLSFQNNVSLFCSTGIQLLLSPTILTATLLIKFSVLSITLLIFPSIFHTASSFCLLVNNFFIFSCYLPPPNTISSPVLPLYHNFKTINLNHGIITLQSLYLFKISLLHIKQYIWTLFLFFKVILKHGNNYLQILFLKIFYQVSRLLYFQTYAVRVNINIYD